MAPNHIPSSCPKFLLLHIKCLTLLHLQSRQELEQHSVDTASTSDAVTFITYVQSLKRKIKQFEKQVEVSLLWHAFAIHFFRFNLHS